MAEKARNKNPFHQSREFRLWSRWAAVWAFPIYRVMDAAGAACRRMIWMAETRTKYRYGNLNHKCCFRATVSRSGPVNGKSPNLFENSQSPAIELHFKQLLTEE